LFRFKTIERDIAAQQLNRFRIVDFYSV